MRAFMSISGADHRARLEAVGDLHRPGGLGPGRRAVDPRRMSY
jgi:hypothetical protein